MAVQLIIDGQHITDVLAQVHTLADATRGGEAPSKNVDGGVNGQTGSMTSALSTSTATPKSETTSAGGKTEAKPEAKKTLTREEQDAAVEEMIAAGEKDGRFEMLTKGRQKAVDDGITAKAADIETGAEDANLDDMFAEDEPAAEVEVTADTIREMMGSLDKDEDGNTIQENLLKIRDILVKFVPKGEEIKVGKIPADKLAAVYAELQKLAA